MQTSLATIFCTCRKMSASHDVSSSTRGECRWPRADAAVHLQNRVCPAVNCLHAPRVSQLLFPSCSFPDMRPATNSFSWYTKSTLDWFPRITGNLIVFPQKGCRAEQYFISITLQFLWLQGCGTARQHGPRARDSRKLFSVRISYKILKSECRVERAQHVCITLNFGTWY